MISSPEERDKIRCSTKLRNKGLFSSDIYAWAYRLVFYMCLFFVIYWVQCTNVLACYICESPIVCSEQQGRIKAAQMFFKNWIIVSRGRRRLPTSPPRHIWHKLSRELDLFGKYVARFTPHACIGLRSSFKTVPGAALRWQAMIYEIARG